MQASTIQHLQTATHTYPIPVFKQTDAITKANKTYMSMRTAKLFDTKANKLSKSMPLSDVSFPTADLPPGAVPAVDGNVCSCTPTSYSFKLNFNGDCSDDISLANVVGIDGNICFFAQGSDVLTNSTVDFEVGSGVFRRRGLKEMAGVASFNDINLSSQLEHAKSHQTRQRSMQEVEAISYDFVPTTITSISFFEADTTSSFNIINQELTFVNSEGGNLTDGDVLNFTSISSKLDPSIPIHEQIDLVPGGVMLVLFGINSVGVTVQNTVAWGYKTNCDGEILLSGGSGWITFEDIQPPMSQFCHKGTTKRT